MCKGVGTETGLARCMAYLHEGLNMIPIKGKTYDIDFYDVNEPNLSYKGKGECLGKSSDLDNAGNILYIFELPNNICYASFAEEDIISVHWMMWKNVRNKSCF